MARKVHTISREEVKRIADKAEGKRAKPARRHVDKTDTRAHAKAKSAGDKGEKPGKFDFMKVEELPKLGRRPTVEEIAAALRKTLGMKAIAARLLRCHRTTVTAAIDDSPELQELLETIKQEALDRCELKLQDRIAAGDHNLIRFYLRTQGKSRGFIESTVVEGSKDAPLEVNVHQEPDHLAGVNLSRLTLEERRELRVLFVAGLGALSLDQLQRMHALLAKGKEGAAPVDAPTVISGAASAILAPVLADADAED